MICMLICMPAYDFNHLPYFCGIEIYCDMVAYLTQLLSGWKCNCFVNACDCCNCLSVPLLEFGVTSPTLSGTRLTVRLLFCVIRPLAATPLVSHHCSGNKDTNYAIILALRNHHSRYKNGIIYVYTSFLVRTQKIEEIVTTLMKPIFNWGRPASEIVMAARGWSNRDLVTRGNHSPGSTK